MLTCRVNIDHTSRFINIFLKNPKMEAFLAKFDKANSGSIHIGNTYPLMLGTLVFIS